MKPKHMLLFAMTTVMLAGSGCQSVKYSALEKVGIHKREILVDDVKKARDAQQEAKQQFENALEQFNSIVNFDGGELEKRYEKLKKVLARSESKAQAVGSRINAVEDVGMALFKEWNGELKQYTSKELRQSSEAQYDGSLEKYHSMIGAMRQAESKIEPVLKPLRDQVLFLKHNLNAQAISALKKELSSIENNVAALIQELEAAIAEADRFIAEMQ